MLILEKDPKSPVAEAFRTLRTNIQYSSFDKRMKTILVTSAGPGEGKSTTCANLALTIAETSKKVLLIDCDLRKPTMHKKFKVSNEKGISDFLVGDVDLEEALKKYKENLYIMTSGTIPPNPSEMLASNKLKTFLEDMEDKFDYILIDSPPVLAVTDAQILSTIADGVIMVVASGQTAKEMSQKAKELLLKVKANILGVILTKVEIRTGKSYNSKYGYAYYYYYNEDGDKVKKKKSGLDKLKRKGA
ncbi:CpsD/CapB family tyrosine-protein kinase [Haloimpatiens sp. FM7315]|uniref:CpsD/CapB family tyrosine-protein kinase n=1 Tax=Haloimpatiens sp. FM7315 TaxID=3298609 RepID=UPI00370CAE08